MAPPADLEGPKRILRIQPVEFAYVFGSVATGRTGALSDLDLAAFLKPSLSAARRDRLRLRLLRELSSAAGQVDLIILNDAPLNLRFSSVQGRLLFSRNERLRVAFEAAARSRYFDRLYYINRGAATTLAKTARRGLLRPW
jgi:predicted nucleotidyltransferase